MKIVADSKIPYIKGLLETVAQEVIYVPGAEITSDVVRDANVLLTRTRTRCDRALLEGSSVEFIGTATIGTDHIDLDYCREKGIDVANAPGCNAPAVAQWVHSTIVRWLDANKVSAPITLGVVGVGHVGSIVARWAQELGYKVLLNDPPLESYELSVVSSEMSVESSEMSVESSEMSVVSSEMSAERSFCAANSAFCILHSALKNSPHSPEKSLPSQLSPLNCLQRECDIITFHTPLTSDGDYPTWHLCDEEFLQGLKKCRLIINAARGAVCDNKALLRWHGDLALDCWENEPEISRELLDKAFVATPHIAGYSRQGKMRGTAMIIEALNRRYGWQLPLPLVDKPLAGAVDVTPEMITSSYNPLDDTAALKAAPHRFEALRNSYPLREEV